jgi:DNA-binding response OmpR family regulator
MAELVLFIDVDDVERRRLCAAFEQAGFGVVEASSGVEGLFQVLESAPLLIILAEEVPPLKAADLLTVLRRLTDAPVMIIGGGVDPEEVAALEGGADFYARRPVSLRVLLARARALLRRYAGSAPTRKVNLLPSIATGMTATERRLLVCLAAHDGRPVAAQQLVVEVWGGKTSTGSVKFYVWRLRRKLQGSGLGIQALPAVGYRLMRDGVAASQAQVAV